MMRVGQNPTLMMVLFDHICLEYIYIYIYLLLCFCLCIIYSLINLFM